jgi:alpha-glucosidase
MVADYPLAYEGQPGWDFLKLVPTWWDETKVLAAEVGELLVTARRKGAKWYLGGMAATRPRDLTLPLSSLGAGPCTARIWKDAADAESNPNHLTCDSVSLSPAATLRIHLAPDGGFVAELTPAGN